MKLSETCKLLKSVSLLSSCFLGQKQCGLVTAGVNLFQKGFIDRIVLGVCWILQLNQAVRDIGGILKSLISK